jgi:hypothetical protein
VRFGTAFSVVAAAQIAVSAMAVIFWAVARPPLLDLLAPPSPLVGVALSRWLLPAAALLGVGCTFAAAVARLKRSQRMRLAASGLCGSAFVFVFAALASLAAAMG